MAPQAGSLQESAGGSRGLTASQYAGAPQDALASSGTEKRGEQEDYLLTIGKALQRLNLSAEEKRAWRGLQTQFSKRIDVPQNTPESSGLQAIRSEVQQLMKLVTQLAGASKQQQSWA